MSNGTLHTPFALERPPFGQFARQRVALTTTDLSSCLTEQKLKGGKIGAILVRRGLLTPDQRLQILRDQARWVARAARSEVASGFPYPASLSLCLPAYNEEGNIVSTIEAACAVLPEFVADFEIVVVDDGSRDRTAHLVRQLAKEDFRIRLIVHEQNRGYGAATTTGLQAASGDLVLMMDSDGQFNLLDLPGFLAAIEDHDVAVGYRYCRAEKRVRRFNGWAWTQLVRRVLDVPLRDLDCAFKLFRRELIEQLEFHSRGAAINAELMSQCFSRGCRIAELPVAHYERYDGTQTGANPRVIARAFRELLQLRRWHAEPRENGSSKSRGGVAASPNSAAIVPNSHLSSPTGRHSGQPQWSQEN